MKNSEFKFVMEENFNLKNPTENCNIPVYEFAKDLYYLLISTSNKESQDVLNKLINTYVIFNKKFGSYNFSFKNVPQNVLNEVREKALPIRLNLQNKKENQEKNYFNKKNVQSKKIAEQFNNELKKFN